MIRKRVGRMIGIRKWVAEMFRVPKQIVGMINRKDYED